MIVSGRYFFIVRGKREKTDIERTDLQNGASVRILFCIFLPIIFAK
jgi:hypothetical protein